MSDFIISCCSTADLSARHFADRGILYIPFHYSLNDVTYPDDLGRSMTSVDFYQAMRNGADTKTSQVIGLSSNPSYLPARISCTCLFPAAFPAPVTAPGWPRKP